MKFFTRQLYDAQQGDPDLPEVVQADKEWHAVSERYQCHIASLRPQLPNSMQQLCDTSLHDGVIESVSREGNEIHLHIAGCGCWGPGGPLELIFRGVKSAQGIEDITGAWWLYEEVHPSDVAAFEYHVLLDRSEFVVAADAVQLVTKDGDP